MAKKKRKSSSWLKRELNKKLYYSAILLIFLLCIVFAFAYSMPSIGIPIETQIQNFFQKPDWNQSNLPIKLNNVTPIRHTYTFFINATSQKITKPTGLTINESDSAHSFTVNIGTLVDIDFGRVGNFYVTVTSPQNIFQCIGSGCLPHSSPPDSIYDNWVTRQGSAIIKVETNTSELSPTPVTALSVSTHQPNKLVVMRQGVTSFYLTVSNSELVKKIYNDILQLPVYTGMYKCPQDSANAPVYMLTFYQDSKITDTAVLTTTGCRSVTLDNYAARLDNGFLSSFDTDFQNATGISGL